MVIHGSGETFLGNLWELSLQVVYLVMVMGYIGVVRRGKPNAPNRHKFLLTLELLV